MSIITDLSSLDRQQKILLYKAMGRDSALFAEITHKDDPAFIKIPDCHRLVYNAYDKQTNEGLERVCVVEPRGFGKSTKKILKSAQDICYAHEKVVCFTSESSDQGNRDLEALKNKLYANEVINALYGSFKGVKDNEKTLITSNDIFYCAVGFKTRIRGIHRNNVRLTKVWADDFESEGNALSDKGREDVKRRIGSQLSPAGANKQDGGFRLVFLGTIVHPDSYLALADKNPIFTKERNGYYLKIDASDDVDNIGNPRWPENDKFSYAGLKELRFLYESQNRLWEFKQEYYGIPHLLSDPKFTMDMVKEMGCRFGRYEDITWIEHNGTKIPINIFFGVDPSLGLKEGNDNSIIFIMGVTPSKNKIILHIEVDKMEMKEQVQRTLKLARIYPPTEITIETYGFQLELSRHVRDEMIRTGEHYVTREFQENISKKKKLVEGLSPSINSGEWSYIAGCTNIKMFLDEGSKYSGQNSTATRKDDTLDGAFLANNNCYAPAMYDVDAEIRQRRLMAHNFSRESGFEELNAVRDWRVA